mmetsp:Transcript_13208/g.38292  ORF Transcript_13208/g.38292 Transcript_13208/m.38292 type:complete len:230 (-) Transcript_13208:1310-1999(-)
MQFKPLPRNSPRIPSCCHMCRVPCHTPVYTLSFPCTCINIFSRSSGATAVRDTDPATPPARSDLLICDHDRCRFSGFGDVASLTSDPPSPFPAAPAVSAGLAIIIIVVVIVRGERHFDAICVFDTEDGQAKHIFRPQMVPGVCRIRIRNAILLFQVFANVDSVHYIGPVRARVPRLCLFRRVETILVEKDAEQRAGSVQSGEMGQRGPIFGHSLWVGTVLVDQLLQGLD